MDAGLKRKAIILLLVVLSAAFVLSLSLADLRLDAGDPFPGASSREAEIHATALPRAQPAAESAPVLRGLMAAIFLAIVLYLLVRIITYPTVKQLIGGVLALAAILFVLLSLPRIPPGQQVILPAEAAANEMPSFEYPTAPLGRPPGGFVWMAAIAGFGGAAIAVAAALRYRRNTASLSRRLRQEARKALGSIEAGADSTNVIIRCYLHMTQLIQKERGLERDHGMTVREFETALENLGLPRQPLLRLRTLFEAVRYGNRRFNAEEEQQSLNSLKEIMSFLMRGEGSSKSTSDGSRQPSPSPRS